MACILVVDDHLPTRELLRALFEYHGHRVLLAADGPEALVLAGTDAPDLVFADIVMPAMDGFSFVQLLRAHTHCTTAPVVMMSASLLADKAARLAKNSGAIDYIAKPFEPEAVLAKAQALLGAQQAA